MSVNLSPIGNDAPFIDSSGNPLSGGLLYTYTAGSSTPQTTYTTSAGSVANANPIVLGSGGYPTVSGNIVSVWLTAGVNYKFTLKTSAGVEVWTRDNISGINDTNVSQSEWVSGPAPTYIGATSFSLVGDQTTVFNVGRRLRTTNSGGTIYSTIVTSAYGALTTVTVINDSGTLDAGLSAVSYGLLSNSNPSLPHENTVILGHSATATQNFVFNAPADGTITLKRGNVGAESETEFSISAAGVITFPQGIAGSGGTTNLKAPTRQVFLTGTAATYTTPSGCRLIVVRMKGGGGGGSGGTASDAGTGGSGGASIFNSIQAAGAGGGTKGQGNAMLPGDGGTGGTGTASVRIAGAPGGGPVAIYLSATNVQIQSGDGGGQGHGKTGGSAAIANSGGGGAGGATGSVTFANASAAYVGAPGGEGEYAELVISSPAANYTYTVGAGGSAGSAGTAGSIGYAGGSGYIVVDEYY